MSEWMLRRGRRPPVGPVTTERLIRAIKVGRVPPDTEATRVGSDDWRPYARYPELEPALDSSDVTERPSEGPPLRLESERAGPNTARSPGTAAVPARPSSAQASPPPSFSEVDEDDDEAVTQVVSTPFAATELEPVSEREAPRPAAGVPPPKPPGWSSSRPGPPSQPAAHSAASAAPPSRAEAERRPAAAPRLPTAITTAPRPAAGVAAPPRPTPPRLSSPIAVPPPAPTSPRATLSRPSTPGPLPPPPLSNPFAAGNPPVTTSPSASATGALPRDEDDELDDEARTHVVASPADLPTNRPPGLRPPNASDLHSAPQTSKPHEPQIPVVSAGVFPPPAVATPLPVAPVMIAPPEPTRVRTPPPPPMPSYPPPPVLDATTKALIALIVALSIGLTIVLFLLWRRS